MRIPRIQQAEGPTGNYLRYLPSSFKHKVTCSETKQEIIISFWPMSGMKHVRSSVKYKPRTDKKQRHDRIIAMYQSGKRMIEIMNELKVGNRTISRVLKANNIERKDVRKRIAI